MDEPAFDLLARPWVRVRGPGGVEEVSLVDAFTRAHEFEALGGEIPTQDAALLRLMIAILHRAVEPVKGYPHERWARLWRAQTLPMDLIAPYLERWRHRFDLLDPRMPFLQVAGLRASKTSGLVKLIADVPDGRPFFSTRAGAGAALSSISFAEAARWLVHCHAYDVSGIKTGAVGDDRVKGGRGYPIGTGWAGRCGLVILEHQTLRDALLLNLVLTPRDSDAEPDLPVWEREPLTAAVETNHAAPHGAVDLMTWPSRRVLLHHDGSDVTDVLISNGDRITSQNRHTVEPMSGFRRSPNQEKTLGTTPVYMPYRHDPSRALWRGLAGLLADRVSGGAVRSQAPDRLPPENLGWLSVLRGERVLDPDLPIRLRAVGMSYGTQDSSVETTYDDALRLHVAVATDAHLRATALAAAGAADDAVQQLASLAANIARAGGRVADGPRDDARDTGFARLDEPYRRWLSRLHADADTQSSSLEWQRTARAVVLSVGTDTIAAGGEAAWKGRDVQGRHLDSSLAQGWFFAGLRKCLPLAAPCTDSKEAS